MGTLVVVLIAGVVAALVVAYFLGLRGGSRRRGRCTTSAVSGAATGCVPTSDRWVTGGDAVTAGTLCDSPALPAPLSEDTSWTDALIPWPRCRSLDPPRGGCGLLLAGDLVRAVRHESAAAVRRWWGVTVGVVWRWRKALGVVNR